MVKNFLPSRMTETLNEPDIEKLKLTIVRDGPGPAIPPRTEATPHCGAAVASDVLTAYDRAFECDPMSAFGGIVALTGAVTEPIARHLIDIGCQPPARPDADQSGAS